MKDNLKTYDPCPTGAELAAGDMFRTRAVSQGADYSEVRFSGMLSELYENEEDALRMIFLSENPKAKPDRLLQ